MQLKLSKPLFFSESEGTPYFDSNLLLQPPFPVLLPRIVCSHLQSDQLLSCLHLCAVFSVQTPCYFLVILLLFPAYLNLARILRVLSVPCSFLAAFALHLTLPPLGCFRICSRFGLFLGLLSFCPGVLEDQCFSFSSAVLSTGYQFQVLLVMWKDFWISSNLPQILGTKEDWGRNREVFLLRRLHAGLTHLHFSWWPELVICPYAPARNPLTKI